MSNNYPCNIIEVNTSLKLKLTVELEIEGVDEADGDNELFLNKEIMIYEIVDAYLVPELMYNINFCHKVRKGGWV